jgi:DNA repair protein RadA/Sms
MAKPKVQFLCTNCGSVHPKWMGKCPDCGTWDSLQEYKAPTPDARAASRAPISQSSDVATAAQALALDEIDQADAPRTPTGIGEFDRILGGGVVPGSAVLVGGEPGIGKSTLLLQVANDIARGAGVADALLSKQDRALKKQKPLVSNYSEATDDAGAKVLYVTSEESARQTKLRASRLGIASKKPPRPRGDQRRADHQPDPQGQSPPSS